MLLIVGGTHDAEARSAVARINRRLGPRRAALLDAVDLSRPGWRLYGDHPEGGTIVADGRQVQVRDIQGVLVRRMAVYPQELQHVHADDRAYVASEMTALLAWWLQVLPVPVMNRADRGSLCGPGWRAEQWRARASQIAIRAVRMSRESSGPYVLPPIVTDVVVVGDAVVGHAPCELADAALALARGTGVVLLNVGFDESGSLVMAHTMPRLTDEMLMVVSQHIGLEPDRCKAGAEPVEPGMLREALQVVPVGAK